MELVGSKVNGSYSSSSEAYKTDRWDILVVGGASGRTVCAAAEDEEKDESVSGDAREKLWCLVV
jgi:hypothetical protein